MMRSQIKTVLCIVLATILVSCGSSTNTEDENVPKEEVETLVIELDGAWVREYPVDGDVLMKLPLETVCEVLKKGKEDVINSKRDFWYKIKHQGTEGWIFGSQTSLKQKELTYSIPRELVFNSSLEYGMCRSQCLIEEFFPIGWSDDGNYFAFIKQPENEAIGGYDFLFYIQDMGSDAYVWEWSFREHKNSMWDERTRADIITVWNKANAVFTQKLNQYGIVQLAEVGLVSFPVSIQGKAYSARIEKNMRNSARNNQPELSSDIIYLNGEGLGSKAVSSKYYGQYDGVVNSSLAGAMVAPSKDRIALLKVYEKRGWEGPPNVLSFQVVGGLLDKGFE